MESYQDDWGVETMTAVFGKCQARGCNNLGSVWFDQCLFVCEFHYNRLNKRKIRRERRLAKQNGN